MSESFPINLENEKIFSSLVLEKLVCEITLFGY